MGRVINNDRVLFGSTEIVYSIRRSPERSHLAITVCGPLVEVAAPAGMRAKQIQSHVLNKAAWVLRRLDETRRHRTPHPENWEAGIGVRLLGRQYLLRVQRNKGRRAGIQLAGDALILETGGAVLQEIAPRLFQLWCREELRRRLPGMVNRICKRIRIPTASFAIRELGARWGSCGPTGKLNFHWLLATQSVSFIEHVVAHEACHLIVPNHSPAFCRLLSRIAP